MATADDNGDCADCEGRGHGDVPLDGESTASTADGSTDGRIDDRADDTVVAESNCKMDAAVAVPATRSAAAG